jgi:hypothetical protein
MSPVFCAPSPLNQTLVREFVDQEHHPTGENTEKPGQPLLIQPRRSRDEPEDACVGRSDAEGCDSVREPAGGMRAELCQEKCSSSRSVFGSTHGG